MNVENLEQAVMKNAATFASTMCYRSLGDMQVGALEHDGNVALISEHMMQGKHDVWRAMYEATRSDDTLVLFVTPNVASSHGVMLLIEDEIDRSPFPDDVWGVERHTQNEMRFDNGSRIVTKAVGDAVQDAPGNVRGYHPDLLVVYNWSEDGALIPEETKENVLVPMAGSDTDIWINATAIRDDALFDWAFSEGVYVERMDR